jgi:hypothetical protein
MLLSYASKGSTSVSEEKKPERYNTVFLVNQIQEEQSRKKKIGIGVGVAIVVAIAYFIFIREAPPPEIPHDGAAAVAPSGAAGTTH